MDFVILIIILIIIFYRKSKKKDYNINNNMNNNIDSNIYNNINSNINNNVNSYMNNNMNDKINNNIESLKNTETISYKYIYKPKRYITTLNEMRFYEILLEIAKELDYILFSQVSLYNIVCMKRNLDYGTKTKYFNKIASKSIDFVLVDKKCRIKLCIELDDSTHFNKKRIERDLFINKLFKDLEIDLLRYPVYHTYYKETLKKKIQENIKEHYYID